MSQKSATGAAGAFLVTARPEETLRSQPKTAEAASLGMAGGTGVTTLAARPSVPTDSFGAALAGRNEPRTDVGAQLALGRELDRADSLLRFTRVALTNLAPGATPAQPVNTVLRSFAFEQRGNQILITDADGSVYVGQIVDAMVRSKRVAPTSSPRPSNRAGLEDGVMFTAMGTNRSLGQIARVEATLHLTPGESVGSLNGARRSTVPPSPATKAATAPAQPASDRSGSGALRVVGWVRIGAEQAELHAIQAPR
jgi:hypothetical protein